jgi:ribonuclease-3
VLEQHGVEGAFVEESGPDHDKRFVYEVDYGGTIRARGEGPSKKEAQRRAAKSALATMMSQMATAAR